jgi:hypothetical protein
MTLNLVIKEKHLHEIVSGEKKEEYRDLTDRILKQVCNLDENGDAIDFKPIKALKLFAGYRTDRKFAVVEVDEIAIDAYLDENDNETDDEYFVFSLGKIIEKNF